MRREGCAVGVSENAAPLGFAVVAVLNAHHRVVVAHLVHPIFSSPFSSVDMSDLCPVYAPFFGAMVRPLVRV